MTRFPDHILRRSGSSRHRSGFALIIALALVVLVAISVVAFLSTSALNRQISSNSTNQARVDIFARGALAVTLADLQQEIVDGSTVTPITAGPVTSTLYLPRSNATMVPWRVGSDAALPNLVKRSANGAAFYSGANYAAAGPARAANSSSATSSRNYRSVPLSAWNKAFLLPKKAPLQSTDLTPHAKFIAPDWVYMARDGSNPTSVSSNIVGRYAYTIYDEGGLLNINVAGYPSTLPLGQAGRKLGAGTADLTLLGLTTSDVDAIVGWRSYASAKPDGTFPGYAFPVSASTNYYNNLLGNSRGFLTIGGPLRNNQSDRIFGSRQQLIQFLLQGIATTPAKRATFQNALQYLGTFSRDLDQPSFIPHPLRPKVVGPYVPATDGTLYASTSGGNNAYGLDDAINPSFLAVRATTVFARCDGSNAEAGEPLVRKRFLLNRLCWLTYKGPSGSLDASDTIITKLTDQGVPLGLIQSGTPANIFKYFGLTWNAATGVWTYAHGVASGIGKLSDVQGLAREPDFFELLKAGMVVGSLAKGSSSNHNGGGSTAAVRFPVSVDTMQYNLDTNVDAHIAQIAANIVDQYDADSYPVRIVVNGTEVSGIENLPYVYRARVIGLPVDLNGTVGGGTGRGLMLLLPEVWNPHDPNSPAGDPKPARYRFLLTGSSLTTSAFGRTRVFDKANSPFFTSYSPSAGTIVTQDSMTNPTGVTALQFAPLNSTVFQQPVFLGNVTTAAGTAQATSIGLTVPGSNNLRTLSIASPYTDSDGYVKDIVSNLSYCGILLGDFPLKWNTKIVSSSTNYDQPAPFQIPLITTGAGSANSKQNPSTADQCILACTRETTKPSVSQAHYILQYQNAAGTWITYQDNFSILPACGYNSVATGEAHNPALGEQVDISSGTTSTSVKINDGGWLTWIDPRTSRFGSMASDYFRTSIASPVTASNTAGNFFGITNRPALDYGMGTHYSAPGSGLTAATSNSGPLSPNATQVGWYPGNWNSTSTANTLFVPGFYAENITSPRAAPQSNANYFTDPDGVARRGMGACVSPSATSTVGMPMATLSGTQSQSRPFILNRPFCSVAELGYVFSGTPWRNLDFFTPESGAAPLLDLFCITETSDPNGLTDGRVSLNTQQPLVLSALLSGSNDQGCAYKDELNAGVKGTTTSLSPAEINNIASALVTRTTSTAAGRGPLSNLSELVGKWNARVPVSGATAPHDIDGRQSYTGFSADLAALFASGDATTANVQRFQESAIRALAASGQTRVWNLMIDVVAQVGRYPANETSLDRFIVEGERHYWLHVAIDRYTGEILDKQLELVNE